MWNRYDVRDNARGKSGDVIRTVGKAISGSALTGFLGLTLLGTSASSSGCSPAGSPPATNSSTSQAQTSNAALEEKIRTNLNTDAQLKAANLNVKANMDRNEVMLTCTVESEAVKTRAIEEVKRTQAGVNVTATIAVDPRCCGSEGMHERQEGMPGMKGMPGPDHRP